MNSNNSIIIITNILKSLIINLIKINVNDFEGEFNEKVDYVNIMINSLFPETKNQKMLLLQIITLFLILYTNFINKDLEDETDKIYNYIKFYGEKKYKINYDILDSTYVLIASLIEADLKNKNGLLKSFDFVLTKNINILQKREDIDYDPYKTPVICEIFHLIVPIFDTLNIYDIINRKFFI